jgi:proteasome accessory factor B
MKVGKVVRLLELIAQLQSGRGSNAAALAAKLGVAQRTIFRDIDTLREAGVPLVYDDAEQRYRIPSNYYLPATNFTPHEALALLILCHQLGDKTGLPFQASAGQAALKLESNLPPRLRTLVKEVADSVRIRLPQSSRGDGHESVYRQLLDAVAARRAVRIRYRSLTEWSEITTKLSPYQLLFSRRSWYAIGRSSLHREVRTFNLLRISRLELLDETFKVPARFTMERYLRNAWHLIPEPGPDSRVVVRFEKMVAHNVAEVLWHKTQELRWLPDGRLEFAVTVSGLKEIGWWILGYGDQAEVLEPPELRDELRARIEKMQSLYAGNSNGGVTLSETEA